VSTVQPGCRCTKNEKRKSKGVNGKKTKKVIGRGGELDSAVGTTNVFNRPSCRSWQGRLQGQGSEKNTKEKKGGGLETRKEKKT